MIVTWSYSVIKKLRRNDTQEKGEPPSALEKLQQEQWVARTAKNYRQSQWLWLFWPQGSHQCSAGPDRGKPDMSIYAWPGYSTLVGKLIDILGDKSVLLLSCKKKKKKERKKKLVQTGSAAKENRWIKVTISAFLFKDDPIQTFHSEPPLFVSNRS